MTGCILLAWLNLLVLDGDLATAEPKTLRYRLLHAQPAASSAADATGPSRSPPPAPGPMTVVTAWRCTHAVPHLIR